MTSANAVRAARLVFLRDLLTERPRTVHELSCLCEVTVDTIARDLVTLQLEPLSVPLIVIDGDRWAILGSDAS